MEEANRLTGEGDCFACARFHYGYAEGQRQLVETVQKLIATAERGEVFEAVFG
jgi:hypothetical protein